MATTLIYSGLAASPDPWHVSLALRSAWLVLHIGIVEGKAKVSTKRVDYRTGHSVPPDPICSTASSAHRTGHGCEESLWIHKPVRDAYRKLERVSIVPKTEMGGGRYK